MHLPPSRFFRPRRSRASRWSLRLLLLAGLLVTLPQAAQAVTIELLTPQKNKSYNGHNSYSPSGSSVQSILNFSMRWRNFDANGKKKIFLDGDKIADDDGLTANGWRYWDKNYNLHSKGTGGHNWHACLDPKGKNNKGRGGRDRNEECSGKQNFIYNRGPIAVPVLDRSDSGQVAYQQIRLQGTLTHSSRNVRPWFFAVWTDAAGQSHTAVSDTLQCDRYGQTGKPMRYQGQAISDCSGVPGQTLFAPSGTTFSSDEVGVLYYDRQPNPRPGQSFSQFLTSTVPGGVSVRWYFRGQDDWITSDMDHSDLALLAAAGRVDSAESRSGGGRFYQNPLAGSQSLTSLDSTFWGPGSGRSGFKWSNRATTDFTRLSPPKFRGVKKTTDANGQDFPSGTATDGQLVRVESRKTNVGQTPMPFYGMIDYFGASRDFEKPFGATVRFERADGSRTADTAVSVPTISSVVIGADKTLEEHRPADWEQLDPWPTPEAIIDPDPTREIMANPPADTPREDDTNDRNSSWKLDFGHNQATNSPNGLLQAGAPAELAHGDSIVVTYFLRANRNRTLNTAEDRSQPADPRGDYRESINLQHENTLAYGYFQYDYDNPERVWGHVNDPEGLHVAAPSFRGGRGSIGSNANVSGYDPSSATYVITAAGTISHVTAPGAFDRYAGDNPCSPAGRSGGVDWRRDMMTNVENLLAGPKQTDLAPLLASGDLGGRVWLHNGPLTINSPVAFRRSGTILVNGDLTINANLSYAVAKDALHSLGVIVLGNLRISAGVTGLVGSYYVSDVDTDATGKPQYAPGGCPVVTDSRGTINTGYDIPTVAGDKQLLVNGLMVGRYFNFPRYYLDPSGATLDPAESVYYDGRVLAATPPGFSTFRQTSWYEVAP